MYFDEDEAIELIVATLKPKLNACHWNRSGIAFKSEEGGCSCREFRPNRIIRLVADRLRKEAAQS